jgi:hypothetical protein
MNARDRLEAAQVRLREEREIVAVDDDAALLEACASFDAAAVQASVEIEACRARWRQWDGIREGRPLHPIAWVAAPLLAIMVHTRFDPPSTAVIGWLISGVLSVEAWCWVRTHLRARQLESACWPGPEERSPDAAAMTSLQRVATDFWPAPEKRPE